MRRPRVVIVSENLPIARDHRMRKQAAALLAAGIDVTVICRRDRANSKVTGVTLRDYPAPADARGKLGYLWEYSWSIAMATWQVLRCLIDEGCDAIQVSSTPDIYFPISLALRALGKRVVFDARDLSPEIYARRYQTDSGRILTVLHVLERISYRAANQVLVVNESLSRVARDRCHIDPERVTLVGNGPVMEQLRPTCRDAEGSSHLCCWVGLMGPQDGVELALQAAARLVHEKGRRDIRFVFVGCGDALPGLQDLARRLALGDWVSFPGWLDPEEVSALLSSADVGLEPNLEEFVSPVKIMEYMAHSLPVVAFDLRETRITLGAAGLLVAAGDVAGFADCVERLVDDAVTRRRLGAIGYERVRDELAWEHQEKRYVELYEQLIGREEKVVRDHQLEPT